MKKQKGITLIGLVITIIVLLILAGVSVATLTGENSIIRRAEQARKASRIAEIIEQIRLDIAETQIQNGRNITYDEFEDILEKYGTINYEADGKIIKSLLTSEGYEIFAYEIFEVLNINSEDINSVIENNNENNDESIGTLTDENFSWESDIATENNLEIALRDISSESYDANVVSEAIIAVNSAEEAVDFDEIIQSILDESGQELNEDVSDYTFVTVFSEIGLINENEEILYDIDEDINAQITLNISQLVNKTNISDYRMLLVNPTTAEICLLSLNSVNSQTGEVSFVIPYGGPIALIKK